LNTGEIDIQLDEAYSLAADRGDYAAALSACEAIIQAHPELTSPLKKDYRFMRTKRISDRPSMRCPV
jgi:hypothetical protein